MDFRLPSSQSKRGDSTDSAFVMPLLATTHFKASSSKRKEDLSYNRNSRVNPSVSRELDRKDLKKFFKKLRDLKEITCTQCYVMCKLLNIWGYKGLFPKYEEIARKASVSLSTAKRVLKEMRLRGFISWKNNWNGKRKTSNRYFFTIGKALFSKVFEQDEVKKSPEIKEKSDSLKVSKRASNYYLNKLNNKNKEVNCHPEKTSDALSANLGKLRSLVLKKAEISRQAIKERCGSKLQKLMNNNRNSAIAFLKRWGSVDDYLKEEADLKRIECVLDGLLGFQRHPLKKSLNLRGV